jgi:hypothetical protein
MKGIDMKKIGSVISLSFLVLFLLVVSFPSICFSEQPDSKIWEFYGVSSGGGSFYYNKTNLTKSSNIISVWTYNIRTDDERTRMIESIKKYDLEKSKKYQYYDHDVMLWKIDCENRQSKLETLIHYDDNGNTLSNDTYENTKWESIPPQSIMEGLYNIICVTEKKPYVESTKVKPNLPDPKVWEYFSDNQYYNKKNITKSSNIISVWTYKIVTDDERKYVIEIVKEYDLEKSIKYQHYEYNLSLRKIDCKKRLTNSEETIFYDNNGKVLNQITYENTKWESIPPQSIIEELYDKVCVTPKKTLKKKKINPPQSS